MVEHKANNATTPERTSLGKQTCLVDGNIGEGRFKDQETGRVVPSFEHSEGFHQMIRQEPAQAVAGIFKICQKSLLIGSSLFPDSCRCA